MGAVGLALAAVSSDALVWSRTVSPDGTLSAETPCTAGEIHAGRAIPNAQLPIRNYVPESRILCRAGGRAFMAGVIDVNDAPAGVSAYDHLVEMLGKRAPAQGKPSQTVIAGRRAIINRAVRGGTIAQTGFIEVGPKKIVTVVAGSMPGAGEIADMGAAIDRFYGSIEVKN